MSKYMRLDRNLDPNLQSLKNPTPTTPHYLDHDSLSHGEPVLVVASGDLEDVALVLVAQAVTLDLLAHALLDEVHVLLVVVDLDGLLGARKLVSDVEFHRC